MPASLETQKFVKEELPYRLLMSLYKNARVSLKSLSRQFGVSHHTIAETLKKLEEEYKLEYTLEINEEALGLSGGRLVTVKFGKKPELEYLKQLFQKYIYVQDAYLAEGDFDLVMYVVGLSQRDFLRWQWNLRLILSKYAPKFTFSELLSYDAGFFPLRTAFLRELEGLSRAEKEVLGLLNDNSRIKLKELVKRSRLTTMRVLYIIKKLTEKNIIKRYAALTQNPEKRLLLAYGVSLILAASEGQSNIGYNHTKLWLNFVQHILGEDYHEITSNYVLTGAAVGTYDIFNICTFKDAEELAKFGPDLLQKSLAEENPKIEKAILTGLLVGKWPFHLDDYEFHKRFVLENSKKLE